MSDRDYFCIRDDLFYIMQSTHRENNISLNIISNKPNENYCQCAVTVICDDKICKKTIIFGNNTPRNTLHRKRQKN